MGSWPLAYPHHHFPALEQRHLLDAVLYADRKDMICGLPAVRGGVIAEIGVATGDFSEFLMATLSPSRFIAIDTFTMHTSPAHWGTPSEVLFQNKTHIQFYRDRFATRGGQVEIIEGLSQDSIPKLTNGTFDLIYIDAGHDYDSVKKDALCASMKLKPDGLLVFNDYIMMDHTGCIPYGVVPAVNELVVGGSWQVVGFALQQHMFCDIALRRPAPCVL
jgi:hypothetical protein